MSKETYVGGDILEFIGGKDLSYAKGDIVNIGSQVIQNSKEGIVYGKPDFIKFDGDIDKEGPWLVLRSAKKKGRNATDTATANDLFYGDYPPLPHESFRVVRVKTPRYRTNLSCGS